MNRYLIFWAIFRLNRSFYRSLNQDWTSIIWLIFQGLFWEIWDKAFDILDKLCRYNIPYDLLPVVNEFWNLLEKTGRVCRIEPVSPLHEVKCHTNQFWLVDGEICLLLVTHQQNEGFENYQDFIWIVLVSLEKVVERSDDWKYGTAWGLNIREVVSLDSLEAVKHVLYCSFLQERHCTESPCDRVHLST